MHQTARTRTQRQDRERQLVRCCKKGRKETCMSWPWSQVWSTSFIFLAWGPFLLPPVINIGIAFYHHTHIPFCHCTYTDSFLSLHLHTCHHVTTHTPMTFCDHTYTLFTLSPHLHKWHSATTRTHNAFYHHTLPHPRPHRNKSTCTHVA